MGLLSLLGMDALSLRSSSSVAAPNKDVLEKAAKQIWSLAQRVIEVGTLVACGLHVADMLCLFRWGGRVERRETSPDLSRGK